MSMATKGELEAALPRFLRRCDAESTRQAYERELLRFCTWLNPPLTAELLLDYRDHLRGRSLTPNTVRWRLTVVRAFLDFARADGVAIPDPAPAMRLPRGQTGFAPQILTQSELNRLIDASDRRTRRGKRDALVLAFLGIGGLRAGEVCRLSATDVDVRSGELVLRVDGKGRKQRCVELSGRYGPAVRVYLASWPESTEPGAPFFWSGHPGHEDRTLTVAAVDYLVRQACAQAGLRRISPHVLRHTAASLAIEAGKPLHRVRDMLGHSSVLVTSRYLHVVRGANQPTAGLSSG